MDTQQPFGYSEKIIRHFENPRNVGRIENPEAFGTMTNPICGDLTDLYLRIKSGVIEDAKFISLGCAVTIASASVFTEKIKGCHIAQLLSGSDHEIIRHLIGLIESELGELPKPKLHCPPATVQAFLEAIQQYCEREGELPLSSRIKSVMPLLAKLYKRGQREDE
jgi:nitrogen fixation NifU-like protein